MVTPAQLQRACAGAGDDVNPLARIYTRGKRSVRRSLLVRQAAVAVHWICWLQFDTCSPTLVQIAIKPSCSFSYDEARDTLQARRLPPASTCIGSACCWRPCDNLPDVRHLAGLQELLAGERRDEPSCASAPAAFAGKKRRTADKQAQPSSGFVPTEVATLATLQPCATVEASGGGSSNGSGSVAGAPPPGTPDTVSPSRPPGSAGARSAQQSVLRQPAMVLLLRAGRLLPMSCCASVSGSAALLAQLHVTHLLA